MIKVMSVHITGRAMGSDERLLMQSTGKLDAWVKSLRERMESEIDELNTAFEDGFTLVSSEVVESDQGKAFWLILRKPDTGAPGLLDELMSAAIPPGAPVGKTPPVEPHRAQIVEAWVNLEDVITDYYDDFDDTKLKSIREYWLRYSRECITQKEGFFSLSDILSDDLIAIPVGYPYHPADLPRLVGLYMFDTPLARKDLKMPPADQPAPAAQSVAPAPKPLDRVETIDDVLKRGDYVILDTETTDRDGSEIIQIAIISSKGDELLNTFVKPKGEITQGAIGVHGITPEMVKLQPTFPELLPQLKETLIGKDIIVYNAKFDRGALHRSAEAWGIDKTDWKEIAGWHCAMERFAEIYGQWNDWRKSYTWKKLSEAAAYYGLSAAGAHDALADCRITLAVCQKMVETGFARKAGAA